MTQRRKADDPDAVHNAPEPRVEDAEGPPPEQDNRELSAAEVYPERQPGATAATYAAQTAKDRSRFPGSVPESDREAAEDSEAHKSTRGSALPSEQGRRGERGRR